MNDKPEPQDTLSFPVPRSVKQDAKILAIRRGSTLRKTSQEAFMLGFDLLKQMQDDAAESQDGQRV